MTIDTIPFGKELEQSPVGTAYLSQEENSARYYIKDKGVCVTQSGSLLWFDLPQEEMDGFHFDEMVLNEHLEADFSPEELHALDLIRSLDEQAQEWNLHVVTTSNAGGTNQYAVFYSEQSEAYFMVHMDDLERVSRKTADQMAQAQQNWLAKPYKIRLDETGAFIK